MLLLDFINVGNGDSILIRQVEDEAAAAMGKMTGGFSF